MLPRTILALAAACFTPACLSNAYTVHGSTPAASSATIGDEVILEVTEKAVSWAGGDVGRGLQAVLSGAGGFTTVHYPLRPRHEVPVTLRVVVRGALDEHAGLGMTKAIVTGLLLFLPVGVIRYENTLQLSADVTMLRGGAEVGSFGTDAVVDVHHILFADAREFTQHTSQLAIDALGARILELLSNRSDWFASR